MQFLKHDADLIRLLGDCDVAVLQARSNEDLLIVIDRLKAFKGGLQFDHAQSWVLLLLAIVSAISALAGLVLMWFATACLGFASLYIWMSRSAALDELPKNIARKCSFLSNGLRDPGGTADERLSWLNEEFDDYDRGNDSRRIEASARGVYQGRRHQLSFVFHHLHYVNAHNKTKSDGESEKVYEHFDRFSLVVDFPWVTGVTVRSDLPSKKALGPRSSRPRPMNSTGSSVLPVTASWIAQSSRHLQSWLFAGSSSAAEKVNLEFSSQGHLCLSFDDAEVMAYKDPGTLEDLASFYANIECGLELPNLFPVLALVHELAELHDNNFDLPLKVADEMEQ